MLRSHRATSREGESWVGEEGGVTVKNTAGKGQSHAAEIEARSDIVGVWLSPEKTDAG